MKVFIQVKKDGMYNEVTQYVEGSIVQGEVIEIDSDMMYHLYEDSGLMVLEEIETVAGFEGIDYNDEGELGCFIYIGGPNRCLN